MSKDGHGSIEHLDEVALALEGLAGTLDQVHDLDPILQAVSEQVIRVVPGADLASITLLRDGVAETAASTDVRAREIDEAQYAEGDGPCLRAARTGEVVRVAVGTAQELWPHFTGVAQAQDIGSYLASPLRIDEGMTGALNLFGFGPHGFRDLDQKYLELYAAVVEAVMRMARRYLLARDQVVHLRKAMKSRAVIEQAKGILMAARGLNDDEAFQVLVAQSQGDNVKLHTVATRFVADASRRD